MSKKQLKSEDSLPDWAEEVTPSDDVMRKFYAPTGSFRRGPILVPEKDQLPELLKEEQVEHTPLPQSSTHLSVPDPDLSSSFSVKSSSSKASPAQSERRSFKKLNEKSNSAYKEFARKWQRYLYPGQLAVMRTLFYLTADSPEMECFTQYSEIAFETKMSRRNAIYVVNSLVERGFIQRLEVINDVKGKGIRLRIYPNPNI